MYKKLTAGLALSLGLVFGAQFGHAERIRTFNYNLSKTANVPVIVSLWGDWSGAGGIIVNNEAIFSISPGQTSASQTIDVDALSLLRGGGVGHSLEYQIQISRTPSEFYCGWSSIDPNDVVSIGLTEANVDVDLDKIYCKDDKLNRDVMGSDMVEYFASIGDINRDGVISGHDMMRFFRIMSRSRLRLGKRVRGFRRADLNNDGQISSEDLSILFANYGRMRPF